MVARSVITNRETLFILNTLSENFDYNCFKDFDRINEDQLIKKCIDWGVAPLFYSKLSKAGLCGILSKQTLNKFKEFYIFCAGRNSLIINKFFQLHKWLMDEQITVMPVKGLAFILFFYDSPAERFSTDIDLFVRKDDIKGSVGALRRNGYDLSSNSECWHYPPLKDRDNIEVELHYDFRRDSIRGLNYIEQIWQRSIKMEYKGVEISVPAIYDLLAIQAFCSILNGKYGQGHTIKCCADYIIAMRKAETFDWEQFFSICEEGWTLKPVYLILLFLLNAFGFLPVEKGVSIFSRKRKIAEEVNKLFPLFYKEGDLNFDAKIHSLYSLISERGVNRLSGLRYSVINNPFTMSRIGKLNFRSILFTYRIGKLINFSR